jgi:hypothetical protein
MTEQKIPLGQILTGLPGGRIVGPDEHARRLHESINDLELHYAFHDDPDLTMAQIYDRQTMAAVGVDFPVLVMPATARELFGADLPPNLSHLKPYEGELPTAVHTAASFGIVKPGGKS